MKAVQVRLRNPTPGLLYLAISAAVAFAFAVSVGASLFGAYGADLSACDAPTASLSDHAFCHLLTAAPWLPARHMLLAFLLSLPGCALLGASLFLALRWCSGRDERDSRRPRLMTLVALGSLLLTPACAALVLRPTPRTWSTIGLAVLQLVLLRRLARAEDMPARPLGRALWVDFAGLAMGLALAALVPDRVTLGALAVTAVSAALAAVKHPRPLGIVSLLLASLALLLGSNLCGTMGLQCPGATPNGAPLTGGGAAASAQLVFALTHGLFPLGLFLIPLCFNHAQHPPDGPERRLWTFAGWLLLLGLPLDAARLLSAAGAGGAGGHLVFAPAWLAVCIAGARRIERVSKAPLLLMLLLALFVLRDLASDAQVGSRALGLGPLGEAYPTLRWFHAATLALWTGCIALLVAGRGADEGCSAVVGETPPTSSFPPAWQKRGWVATALKASAVTIVACGLAAGLTRFSIQTARRSPLSALAQAQTLRGARPLAWPAPAPLPERLLRQENVTRLPDATDAAETWLARHPSGILLTEREHYGALDAALMLRTRQCGEAPSDDAEDTETPPPCTAPAAVQVRSLKGGRFVLASAGSLPGSHRPLGDARDVYRRGPQQRLPLRFGPSVALRGVDVHLPGNGTLSVTPHLRRIGPVSRKVNVVIEVVSGTPGGPASMRTQENPGSPWLSFEHWPERIGQAHPITIKLTSFWRQQSLALRPLREGSQAQAPPDSPANAAVVGTVFLSVVDEDGPLPWNAFGGRPLGYALDAPPPEDEAQRTRVRIAELVAVGQARPRP